MAEEGDGPGEIAGPHRCTHFGERLLARIPSGPQDEQFPQQVLELLREVQYLDVDRYCEARVLRLADEGGADFTVSAWAPETAYLFPPVEFLALESEDDVVFVPFEAVPRLAGEFCRWLDARTLLVEAIGREEWKVLLSHAEQMAVTPAGAPEDEDDEGDDE